jgi:hypothetical protein
VPADSAIGPHENNTGQNTQPDINPNTVMEYLAYHKLRKAEPTHVLNCFYLLQYSLLNVMSCPEKLCGHNAQITCRTVSPRHISEWVSHQLVGTG